MAKIGNQFKLAWLKGMEAIGRGASNLASNAHIKVNEINLETRRRELLSEFPLRAHDLWQKGVDLPDPLGTMMAELNELDEKLSVLRAQRYARVEAASGDKSAEAVADEADAVEADGEASETETNDEAEENAAESTAEAAEADAPDESEPAEVEPAQADKPETPSDDAETDGTGDNA